MLNGDDVEWGARAVAAAKEKMYAARLERKTPYVDKTVYTGWNGMCISAYLAAGRALELPEAVGFALKSLDRVLARAWDTEAGVAHVVAYGEGGVRERIAGVLEDYTFVGTRRWMRGRRPVRCATSPRRKEIARCDAGTFLRYGWVAGSSIRRRSGRHRGAEYAAEAVAGFAYTGGEWGRGGAVVAAGVR